MGIRFQRRAKLSGGLGINLSASGASPSIRTKYGSLSRRGFSLRTGIPGLSFRSGFVGKNGRKGDGKDLMFILLIALCGGALLLLGWNLIRFIYWVTAELIKATARLFAKPASTMASADNDHKSVYTFTKASIPAEYHEATVLVTKLIAHNNSFVEPGTEILEISIDGFPVKSKALGSGTVVHNKQVGDTLCFGETLFSIHTK